MLRSSNLLMFLPASLNSLTKYASVMDGCSSSIASSHLLELEIGHQVANELISPLCPVGLMNIISQMFRHIW